MSVQAELDELAAGLRAARDQFSKAAGEIDARVSSLTGQVAVLEAAVVAGGRPDFSEVKATVAELAGLAQRLDDVVPDAVVVDGDAGEVVPEIVDGGGDESDDLDGGVVEVADVDTTFDNGR